MRARRSDRQPPGPRGRWLSGNLEDYEADRLGFLLATRERFGGVVRFDGRATIVHDPELAIEVLSERTGAFAIRQDVLQRRVDDAALDSWRDARRALSPGMRPQAVHDVPMIVEAVVRDVLGSMSAQAGENGRAGRDDRDDGVEAMPLLERITSRSIARFAFGDDVGDVPQEVGHLLDLLSKLIGNPFALPSVVPTRTRRAVAAQFAHVERLVEARLVRRESEPGRHADYAAALVATGGRHPRERLCRALVGALLAAHRVPAAAVGWTLLLAHEHVEQWERMRVEADRAARGLGDPDCPDTTHAVYEALRLYPPSWLLSRTTTRPVTLGGYELGAGHQVLVSPYVLHRDPRHHPDATAFRPERWASDAAGSTPGMRRGCFMPYGVGPRACPGANVGHHMLRAAVLGLVGSGVRVAEAPVTPDPRTMLVPRGLRLVLPGTTTATATTTTTTTTTTTAARPAFAATAAVRGA